MENLCDPRRHAIKPQGRRRSAQRASGAVVLELILVLPLLLIALLAIVEFGLLLTNLQYVEFASRTGAQIAARLPALPASLTSSDLLVQAVQNELAKGGMQARQITLQYNTVEGGSPTNVCFKPTTPVNYSSDPCPYAAIADAPLPNAYRYVRVTVWVNFREAAPNLLATFGIDYQGAVLQQSTTYPYVYEAP